jgi:hypothetical protein
VIKIAAIAAMVFATCAFAPEGAVPFAPPMSYRAQWDSAQACSGKTGDFDRLKFYVIPGMDFPCPTGRCIGEWSPPHHISIAENWQNINWVVRHEMLHDLVGKHYPGDTLLWGVKCKATWGYLQGDPNYRP